MMAHDRILFATAATGLLKTVETPGYVLMSPIEAASLPPMLNGHDVIAQAMTDSNKAGNGHQRQFSSVPKTALGRGCLESK